MKMRLRSLITVGPSKSESKLPDDAEVTFAPMEAIRDGVGGLDTSATKLFGELSAGSYNYFAEGDILLAKVTPCFENGNKAIAVGLTNGVGFATSEVHVIRPNPKRLDRRYLNYVFSSAHFIAEGIASMTGAGGLRRVSEEAIKNFKLIVPSLKDQVAIADLLDRETARIDAVIELLGGVGIARSARPDSMIGLLMEKRAAMITRYVAGGTLAIEAAHEDNQIEAAVVTHRTRPQGAAA